jgi:hypothetical protein
MVSSAAVLDRPDTKALFEERRTALGASVRRLELAKWAQAELVAGDSDKAFRINGHAGQETVV